jgi:hypothetical protein
LETFIEVLKTIMGYERAVLFLVSIMQSLASPVDIASTFGHEKNKHEKKHDDDKISMKELMGECCGEETRMKRIAIHIMAIIQSCAGITGIVLLLLYSDEEK